MVWRSYCCKSFYLTLLCFSPSLTHLFTNFGSQATKPFIQRRDLRTQLSSVDCLRRPFVGNEWNLSDTTTNLGGDGSMVIENHWKVNDQCNASNTFPSNPHQGSACMRQEARLRVPHLGYSWRRNLTKFIHIFYN